VGERQDVRMQASPCPLVGLGSIAKMPESNPGLLLPILVLRSHGRRTGFAAARDRRIAAALHGKVLASVVGQSSPTIAPLSKR
jgi:hypothetical protein